MRLALALAVMPFFIALLLLSNREQDLNILQAKGKFTPADRARLRRQMRDNMHYRNSRKSCLLLFPLSASAFIVALAGFETAALIIAVISTTVVIFAIAFHVKGFLNLMERSD